MTPTLFVEFGLKPFRHLRIIVIAQIAIAARHSGTAAWAGVLAFPRLIGMIFANPSAILADQAFHSCSLARRASSSQLKFGRTSAPFWPQTWQVNSGSRSDSRTSSGHLSPLIAVQWPHL
jgi:hypothetical protein